MRTGTTHARPYETGGRKGARGRGFTFYLLAAASVVALAILAAAMAGLLPSRDGPEFGEQRLLEGGVRAGSAEFEEYRGAILVDALERSRTRITLTDKAVDLTTTVRNQTGRTINGLEMRGVLVGVEGAPLRERIVLPVPDQQARLEPGEAMDVHIRLPRLTQGAAREADVSVEVTAVRFE